MKVQTLIRELQKLYLNPDLPEDIEAVMEFEEDLGWHTIESVRVVDYEGTKIMSIERSY